MQINNNKTFAALAIADLATGVAGNANNYVQLDRSVTGVELTTIHEDIGAPTHVATGGGPIDTAVAVTTGGSQGQIVFETNVCVPVVITSMECETQRITSVIQTTPVISVETTTPAITTEHQVTSTASVVTESSTTSVSTTEQQTTATGGTPTAGTPIPTSGAEKSGIDAAGLLAGLALFLII